MKMPIAVLTMVLMCAKFVFVSAIPHKIEGSCDQTYGVCIEGTGDCSRTDCCLAADGSFIAFEIIRGVTECCDGSGKQYYKVNQFCYYGKIRNRYDEAETSCDSSRGTYYYPENRDVNYACCTADDEIYGSKHTVKAGFECNKNGEYLPSINLRQRSCSFGSNRTAQELTNKGAYVYLGTLDKSNGFVLKKVAFFKMKSGRKTTVKTRKNVNIKNGEQFCFDNFENGCDVLIISKTSVNKRSYLKLDKKRSAIFPRCLD